MKDDIKVMDILRIKGSKQKNWEGAGYTDVIGAFARGDVPHDTKWILGYHSDQ